MLQFRVESPAFKGLDLHILTVVKKAKDEMALAHLKEAEQRVRSAEFNPVCHRLHGEPETVIANDVEENDISLLLMGAYDHSRMRHLVIGSTTAVSEP